MRRVMYGLAGAGAFFLVLPVLALVPMSFSGTRWLTLPPRDLSLRWYVTLFTDRDWLEAALVSLRAGLAATVVATTLGTLAGVGLVRARLRGRGVVRALFLAPLIVPVMVMAIAFYALFARTGLIGTIAGIALAHAVLGSPYVVLNVEAAMRTFDVRLERAARTLGATAWQAFRRVTLPLVRPGILAGALFVFIFSIDEVVVAIFLSGTTAVTLPKLMFDSITQDELNPVVTAVASLQIAMAVTVVLSAAALGRRGARLAAAAIGAVDEPGSDPGAAPVAGTHSLSSGQGVTPARRGHVTAEPLRLVAVSKRFGRVVALEEASLEVAPGEFVTLLGPSGSGKTTLLNLVAGFEAPSSGEIYFGARPISGLPPNRRDVGMVFQDYALFPHLTVFENVAFPLRLRRLSSSAVRARVEQMLDVVHLAGLESRRPRELSGGQQQRVALARALVREPTLLLMDEPLGALDRHLRERMQAEIRQLHRRLGMAVLFVTHDQAEAMAMSDRIVVVNRGRVQQIGRPEELYRKPANAFVATFVGESNLLRCRVVGPEGQGVRLVTEGGTDLVLLGTIPAAGGDVTLMVRPQSLRLARRDDAAVVRGRVEEAVYLGDTRRYQVRLNDRETLTLRLPDRAGPLVVEVGDVVGVAWDPDDVRLLG